MNVCPPKPVDRTQGLDAPWHAALGQLTGGLSPAALMTAYVDWSMHLAASPDKQRELAHQAITGLAQSEPANDPRFADPAWAILPHAAFAQGFLAAQNWWDRATCDLHGVDPKHANIVHFAAR